MVINSSNRSQSPMLMKLNSNPNPNPNAINQERELLGVRKSFTFAKSSISGQPRSLIPNTPANSPAGFVRRCSFGKESANLEQDHEKENERDPNSKPVSRVRSPSTPKLKHFMSPTISAVSKINPSPRKKILGERNEPIRSSDTLSEGKLPLNFSDENGSKEDMTIPEKRVSDVSFSPKVEKLELEPDLVVLSPEPEMPMNNAISSETMPENFDLPKIESDNIILSSNAKSITCSSPSTTIAPLDADPTLPPYDPKTNYLSPRPRFLRYKPNPRIEMYINQGVRFEDGSFSESFSETEISEEVQSDDISSSSSTVGTSLVEEKSISLELTSPKTEQIDENVGPKIKERPTHFGGFWKAVCVIFLLFLGVVALHQENFVLENINSLLSKMSFEPREVKFSSLPFANLTAWQEEEFENHMVNDYVLRPKFDRKNEFVLEPSLFGEEIELKSPDDFEAEIDQFVEEFEREELEENYVVEDSVIEGEEFAVKMIEESSHFTELQNQADEHDITLEIHNEFDNDLKFTVEMVKETSYFPEPENQDDDHDITSETHYEFYRDFKLDDQSLPSLPQSVDVQDDFQLNLKVEDQQLSTLPEPAQVQTQVTTTNNLVTEVSERLAPRIAAISLFIVGATLLMIMKKSKKENSIREEKSMNIQAISKIEPKENPTSWGGPSEVDMRGESYPSEISSFQKTSSYNLKGSNEAHSMDKSSKRNYKRESFASPSSEYTMSSSYGSFTTYSILHSKQRDDEVVTPVRRSNRIRSKVTCP